MYSELSRPARRLALAIALLALLSLGGQFLYLNSSRAEPLLATAWEMARYFTILTTLLVVITLVVISRPRRDGIPFAWLAALTLSWVMAGAVYHLILSDLVSFDGLGWWADHGLHSVGPVALGLWWLVLGPKRQLHFVDLPIFALWPSVYGAYVLARGAADGAYPYPFVDLGVTAPVEVASNLAGLLLLFLLGGVVMIAIGRFADR
jgi:hypothetical protein